MTMDIASRHWPAEGLTRVPYWVYSDRDIYDEEQARIFRGATWNFLCLEAELPGPNSYRRSSLGAMPVVVTRDKDGRLNAFENRCAQRGAVFLTTEGGQARNIIYVYPSWSSALDGTPTGVAFAKAPAGKAGMPGGCGPEEQGPRKRRLATLCGLVFGTLAADTPP